MAQLLLVGSDRDRAADVRSLLRRDGHAVEWCRDRTQWLSVEQASRPELVIAACDDAGRTLTDPPRTQGGFPAPLLLIDADGELRPDPFNERRLVDRISSPFMREELLARVDALIRVRRVISRDPHAPRNAPGDVDPPASVPERLASWLRLRLPDKARPSGPYLEVAARVADWADRRDAFEPGHAERVSSFCAMIAESLQMGDEETEALLRAAMLHDIGKVGLPIEVLHKRGPLEEGQLRLIRTHPARGAALLRALDPDEQVARTVLYHHERPDGTGYYGKLEGVPLAAAVLAVAEAYDAMTSSRVGDTMDSAHALDYLDNVKGRAYDSDCVEALVDALRPRANAIPLSTNR